jgi:hypothetical protein
MTITRAVGSSQQMNIIGKAITQVETHMVTIPDAMQSGTMTMVAVLETTVIIQQDIRIMADIVHVLLVLISILLVHLRVSQACQAFPILGAHQTMQAWVHFLPLLPWELHTYQQCGQLYIRRPFRSHFLSGFLRQRFQFLHNILGQSQPIRLQAMRRCFTLSTMVILSVLRTMHPLLVWLLEWLHFRTTTNRMQAPLCHKAASRHNKPTRVLPILRPSFRTTAPVVAHGQTTLVV